MLGHRLTCCYVTDDITCETSEVASLEWCVFSHFEKKIFVLKYQIPHLDRTSGLNMKLRHKHFSQ